MSDHRHIRTGRLRLDAVTAGDADDLYALHSDPAVWRHYPSGRHGRREETVELLARIDSDWTTAGLGYWSVRLNAEPDRSTEGNVIGIGGCALRHAAWNLYYRLTPSVWGRGIATELAEAACAAATGVRPDVPIVAKLLAHNTASRRTAERAGLQLAWRGPDRGNPDTGAIRLVYTDRPVGVDLVDALTTPTRD